MTEAHTPRVVTVTVECACGATGDHIVQPEIRHEIPALIEAAVLAFTDHLTGDQR